MDVTKLRVQGVSLEAPFELPEAAEALQAQLASDITAHNQECSRLEQKANALAASDVSDFGGLQKQAAQSKSEMIRLASQAIALWKRVDGFVRGPLQEAKSSAITSAYDAKSTAEAQARRALTELYDCSHPHIAAWVEHEAVPRHPAVAEAYRSYDGIRQAGMFRNTGQTEIVALQRFLEAERRKVLAAC